MERVRLLPADDGRGADQHLLHLGAARYISVPRDVLLLFPVPLAIAAWSCRRGYAWLLPALASVSVPLLAYQMSLFVDHRWAG